MQPRWWQVFLAGFMTVVLLEFGALALTDRGIGALLLALLAGGVAVTIFLIAKRVWLSALLVGMAIAFFSWLAVVAAVSVALPLAAVAGIIGVTVYVFALKRLGVSRAFFNGFMIVFLLVFGASAAITFILPEYFASAARIRIEANSVAAPRAKAEVFLGVYDPYLIQTEFEVMQSEAILGKVIENLGLNQEWSRRYNRGQRLSSGETLALLKKTPRPATRAQHEPYRDSRLSEKADEAAVIANELARVYQNHFEHSESATASFPQVKVEIVDLASPGLRPVRPNKPLNLAIGALAGLLLGTVAELAWLVVNRGRRLPPKVSTPKPQTKEYRCRLQQRPKL
jgi:capsular polysaccharide biosynthesis protein